MIDKLSGYVAIGLVVLLLSAATWVYFKGYGDCTKDQVVKTITVIEKRNEIEQEITTLPDLDLDTRLCKWVRGGC